MYNKLYKYINSRWKIEFAKKGILRLRTLGYYRCDSNDSRQDDKEALKIWSISKEKEKIIVSENDLKDITSGTNIKLKGGELVANPGSEVTFMYSLPNPLAFCTSGIFDKKLMMKFQCDSYFIINDPEGFSRCLFNEIDKSYKVAACCYDFIIYTDEKNERIMGAIRKENIAVFPKPYTVINLTILKKYFGNYYLKDKKYSDEKEFRFIYLTYKIINDDFFVDIECPKLLNFVTL